MRIKNRFLWAIAIISLILDQLTKFWVVGNFVEDESRLVWEGVFNLTYVRNPGAAWSLFSDNGWWLRWLSLGVSIGLMALAWYGPKKNRWEQAGYGFILGGALGNGIDRFVAGDVVDFLDFRPIGFPAIFNLADVFINVGMICLFIAIFRKKGPEERG
ncbi:MAG: signal peptidase II [Hormoscilla sp.]